MHASLPPEDEFSVDGAGAACCEQGCVLVSLPCRAPSMELNKLMKTPFGTPPALEDWSIWKTSRRHSWMTSKASGSTPAAGVTVIKISYEC